MANVLVTYGSRSGSTEEIARFVAAVFEEDGHKVDVLPAGRVFTVGRYEVVVLGSAIYATRWHRDAVRFLRRNADALRFREVWLFHSGPVGDGTADQQVPAPHNVRRIAARIGTGLPITFGGRLEADTAQGFLGRRMARSHLAGDYRDWEKIREWAAGISRRHVHPHEPLRRHAGATALAVR